MMGMVSEGAEVIILTNAYGEPVTQTMTVVDSLSTQFRAEGEVPRTSARGGWEVGSVFCFYKDEGDTWKRN